MIDGESVSCYGTLFGFKWVDLMRRIATCLVIVVLISLFSLMVCGVDIDGDVGNKEWRYGTKNEFIGIGEQSNCNVNFASITYIADKEEYSVYLALKYSTTDYDLKNNHSAVEISINDLKSAVFYANGEEAYVDYESFDAQCAFGFNEMFCETECEMRIGVKYGIKDKLVLGIRIYDYLGRPSNYYEITIYDETQISKEESKTESETENETVVSHKSLSDYEKTTRKTLTTKPAITANTEVVTNTKKETLIPNETKETVFVTHAVEKETTIKNVETCTVAETEAFEEKATTGVSQTEIFTKIDEEKVQQSSKLKTVGYSAATGLIVSAVFISVIVAVVNTMRKKKNTDD